MGADMTLVDQDDGCEAGRTLIPVKLRDVRMNLSNTGFTDTFSHYLKHPLSIVNDWWGIARIVQHDVPAMRSGAAHA